MDNSKDLAELIARENIRDCLARLSRGEDRRDPALISGCFWPDATVDFGIFVGGFKAYLAWVTPGSPSIPVTLHTLGQSLIDVRGDFAGVETHVTAYHRIDYGDAQHDVVLSGRYLDLITRTDGQWRIAHRNMIYDWVKDLGVSVDWSQGLMGMAFLHPRTTGAAVGDPSVDFFRAHDRL